jgi:adenylate cyclase
VNERQRSLREIAGRLGADEGELDRAEAEGTLALLAVDRVLSEEPRYSQNDLSELTGLGEDAKRFWRGLGFPDPQPDEKVFTETDLEMLRLVEQLLRLELVETDVALQMTRAIGSGMARIAQAQMDAIEAALDRDTDAEQAAVMRTDVLLPTMPRILEYVWRRHLQAAVRSRLMREAGPDETAGLAVGFADLVGFTALSQQLSERELADVVDRFESLAYDTVASRGGRVVKMIGDEVMFAVGEPDRAVDIALALAEAYRDEESLSDVRVGVAFGPVLEREGDLYGPTVNLASRIVGIAFPGAVVVSHEVREALADNEELVWKSLRARSLRHIGRVQLYAVRRAGDESETMWDRARRRRGALKNLVVDLMPGVDDVEE